MNVQTKNRELLYWDGSNMINRGEMQTLMGEEEVMNCVIESWSTILNAGFPTEKERKKDRFFFSLNPFVSTKHSIHIFKHNIHFLILQYSFFNTMHFSIILDFNVHLPIGKSSFLKVKYSLNSKVKPLIPYQKYNAVHYVHRKNMPSRHRLWQKARRLLHKDGFWTGRSPNHFNLLYKHGNKYSHSNKFIYVFCIKLISNN